MKTPDCFHLILEDDCVAVLSGTPANARWLVLITVVGGCHGKKNPYVLYGSSPLGLSLGVRPPCLDQLPSQCHWTCQKRLTHSHFFCLKYNRLLLINMSKLVRSKGRKRRLIPTPSRYRCNRRQCCSLPFFKHTSHSLQAGRYVCRLFICCLRNHVGLSSHISHLVSSP